MISSLFAITIFKTESHVAKAVELQRRGSQTLQRSWTIADLPPRVERSAALDYLPER